MKTTSTTSKKSITALQNLSFQDTQKVKGGLSPRQFRRLLRRLRNGKGTGTGPSSGIGNSGGGRPPMVTVNGMSR